MQRRRICCASCSHFGNTRMAGHSFAPLGGSLICSNACNKFKRMSAQPRGMGIIFVCLRKECTFASRQCFYAFSAWLFWIAFLQWFSVFLNSFSAVFFGFSEQLFRMFFVEPLSRFTVDRFDSSRWISIRARRQDRQRRKKTIASCYHWHLILWLFDRKCSSKETNRQTWGEGNVRIAWALHFDYREAVHILI